MLGKLISTHRALLSLRRFAGTAKLQVSHHEDQHHGDHKDGHHQYDWRDDPVANPDLTFNWRNWEFPDPEHMELPCTIKQGRQLYFQVEGYNPKNLTQNVECFKFSGPASFDPDVPETNVDHDLHHELDHQSQDFDFQAQSIKLQHFRKKGMISQWALVAVLPFLAFYIEFPFQGFPQIEHWRKAHPPPLNFPNSNDTPDQQLLQVSNSSAGKQAFDQGYVRPPYYKIENGKKIYLPHAGVNKPMPHI